MKSTNKKERKDFYVLRSVRRIIKSWHTMHVCVCVQEKQTHTHTHAQRVKYYKITAESQLTLFVAVFGAVQQNIISIKWKRLWREKKHTHTHNIN